MKKTIHITKQKVMELIGEHDLCEIHDDCGRQAMSDCFEELFGFILYICEEQFSRHPFIELDYQDEIRGLIADRVMKVLRSRRSVIIDDDTSAV